MNIVGIIDAKITLHSVVARAWCGQLISVNLQCTPHILAKYCFAIALIHFITSFVRNVVLSRTWLLLLSNVFDLLFHPNILAI